MTCKSCFSSKILSFSAKCNDLFNATLQNMEMNGYIPDGLNIGAGDHIKMAVCLNCGQAQGDFPIPEEAIEEAFTR
jgi:hypothetical protein